MRPLSHTLLSVSAAIAVALLTALTGCRTSQQAAITQPHGTASMSLPERARDVVAGNMPWSQINLPVKIAVRSPQKISMSGRVYMRRDRDIYITLRVFGMEVVNMYVNSDSIYASDRLHKYYMAESIKDMFAGASLSIGDLQDALLGRAFINSRGTLADNMLGDIILADSPDGSWTLTPSSRINGDTEYQFKFSDDSNTLMSLFFKRGNKVYGCTYSDQAVTGNGRFMKHLGITTKVGNTAIDATLTFDFNKVKWEVPASIQRRSYNNYRRITPHALAKAIKEM